MTKEREPTVELILAIEAKDQAKAEDLIYGVPGILRPEVWENANSPLHKAAEVGWIPVAMRIAILSPLLGASKNRYGATPYDVAKEAGFDELAEQLRDYAFPKTFGYDPETEP